MSFPTNVSLEKVSFVWLVNVEEEHRTPFMVCYALILVLSIVGNTSIIAVVARNTSMQSTVNYLIANMAATDLVASVVVITRYFSNANDSVMTYKVLGILGESFCRLFAFIRDVSLFVSIYSMVAIAFDRFFAVVFPIRVRPRLLTTRVLLPTIWLAGLGLFAVHLVKLRLKLKLGMQICVSKWPAALGGQKGSSIFKASQIVILYVLPLIVVAILYTVITIKMKRQIVPGQTSTGSQKRRRKISKSVLKVAITVVLSFWICWSPRYILRFIRMFVWHGNVPKTVRPYYPLLQNIFVLFSRVNFVIHPYICFAFASNFRKRLKNLFPFSKLFALRILPESQEFQLT